MFKRFRKVMDNARRERQGAICQAYAEEISRILDLDINNLPPLVQLAFFVAVCLDPTMDYNKDNKLTKNYYTRADLLVLSGVCLDFTLSLEVDKQRITREEAEMLSLDYLHFYLPVVASVVLKIESKDYNDCLFRQEIETYRKMAYKEQAVDVINAAISLIISDMNANSFTTFDGYLFIPLITEFQEFSVYVNSFFGSLTPHFTKHAEAAINELKKMLMRYESEKRSKDIEEEDFQRFTAPSCAPAESQEISDDEIKSLIEKVSIELQAEEEARRAEKEARRAKMTPEELARDLEFEQIMKDVENDLDEWHIDIPF